MRFVWANPAVRITFLMVGVIGTFGFNFNVLVPLEAHQTLHARPAAFGLLSSALGVGALAGALLLAKRGGQPTIKWLATMGATFGVLEGSMLLAHSVEQAMLGMALMGFAMTSFAASANTRVQLASPPEMRGRVMSVYSMVFVGTTPIGNLVVSSLASSTHSVPLSFALSGLPCILIAAVAAYLWSRQPQATATPQASQPAANGDAAAHAFEPIIAAPNAAANVLLAESTPEGRDTRPVETTQEPPCVGHIQPHLPPRTPGQPKLQPRAAGHE
jgi:hypothetical protein